MEVGATENLQRKLLLCSQEMAVTSKRYALGQITDQSCLQVTSATFVQQVLFAHSPVVPRGSLQLQQADCHGMDESLLLMGL